MKGFYHDGILYGGDDEPSYPTLTHEHIEQAAHYMIANTDKKDIKAMKRLLRKLGLIDEDE